MEQQTHLGDGFGVRPDAQVGAIRLEGSDGLPGPLFPVLIYRGAFGPPLRAAGASDRAADRIEKTFARNGWLDAWRDGVYEFHHYHSTAHEVLGCYSGRARLQLGGAHGPHLAFARGDVLVLPAGAAHKRVSGSDDFRVVGAYDGGADYDMQLDDPSIRGHARDRIQAVPMPRLDPVYGARGPLLKAWQRRWLAS